MNKKEIGSKEYIIFYLKGYGNPVPGAESAGFNNLKSIIKENTHHKVIIVSDQKAKKIDNEILYKHKILPINIPILNFLINNFFASRMIKKVSKIYTPRLIHVQGYAGYYPRFKSKIRTLLTLHEDPTIKIFDKNRRDPLKYLEFLWYEFIRLSILRAIKKYDLFHVSNLRTKKFIMKFGIKRDKIFTIPNGIKFNRNLNKGNGVKKVRKAKENLILILIAGSIEYNKGSLNVALSLNYLPKNYHLLIAGRPQPIIGIPYLKKILSLNQKRIHYLGYLQKEDYFSILDKADIYISASLFEACQLAPLEALMMKKKIVVSPAGAIPEFFSLDYPFLIKKNHPSEIADLVLKLSKSEKIILPKGIFSLKSWKEIAKDLNDMYSKIIPAKF